MLLTSASRPTTRLLLSNEIAEIWIDESSGHQTLVARNSYQPGDLFSKFDGSAILQTPSYLTVQVGIDKHICLKPAFLQYINHSCSPNVFFDTANFEIICLQPIIPGDELTYFYPATEWNMAQPFVCLCGSSNCLGYINGASYLSKQVLAGYRLSDFIQQQVITNHST